MENWMHTREGNNFRRAINSRVYVLGIRSLAKATFKIFSLGIIYRGFCGCCGRKEGKCTWCMGLNLSRAVKDKVDGKIK